MVCRSTKYRKILKEKEPERYKAYLEQQRLAAKRRRDEKKEKIANGTLTKAMKKKIEREKALSRARDRKRRAKSGKQIKQRTGAKRPRDMSPDELRRYKAQLYVAKRQRMTPEKLADQRNKSRERMRLMRGARGKAKLAKREQAVKGTSAQTKKSPRSRTFFKIKLTPKKRRIKNAASCAKKVQNPATAGTPVKRSAIRVLKQSPVAAHDGPTVKQTLSRRKMEHSPKTVSTRTRERLKHKIKDRMAASMVQSVIEILDSAHTYRYELAEVLEGINGLQEQINLSSDAALKQVENHFTKLKNAVIKAMDKRLNQLQQEIESIRESALKPLDECKSLVDDGLTSAAQIMEEGGTILKNDPDKNLEAILHFKEDPKTKALGSLPAIPESAEVACVNVSLTPDLRQQLEEAIRLEGKVLAQAPVQITDVTEKPGSLLVQWGEENEDESEVCEFWLQYAKGSHKEINPKNAVFHTAYVGTSTSYVVKHLRTQTAYTFRVCGRGESDTPWSAWSVPRVSATSVEHYQWAEPRDETYSLSNEDKTVTRTNEGLTHIIYSHKASLTLGNTLTMKVLDDADKSPGDGLFIAPNNDTADDFIKGNVIYVNLYGSVFVNGQEMTMQLPEIKRGSVVAFEVEAVSSSKVRVNIQTEDKEVTFDWKVEPTSPSANDRGTFGVGGLGGSNVQEERSFYFGVRFSQEDWKVAVD